MALTDSSFALSMNAQVLTTMHVGVCGVGGDLVPRVAREAQHHLAIDEILRATEGNEAYLHVKLVRITSSSEVRVSAA